MSQTPPTPDFGAAIRQLLGRLQAGEVTSEQFQIAAYRLLDEAEKAARLDTCEHDLRLSRAVIKALAL